MAKTTEELLNDILKELQRSPGRGPGSPSTPSTPSTPSGSGGGYDIDKKTSTFSEKLIDVSKVVKGAYDKVAEDIKGTQGMWQSLSKSGMSFSGDLFAMRNTAIGMRMSQEEMAESFQNFSKDGILIGFGSDLTRSAEGFAKASKDFFDQNSESADSLRRLGMTTKDINELMALQGVTMRGAFASERERNEVAAQQMEKLGNEMDAMAKLTGKSRAEQVETMKKQQADMQFEAAIRLKTQGMNAKEAAEFEANARQQLKDATLLGQGQMFKEIFATGQIMTKEAGTQAALNKEQADATRKAATASADRSLSQKEREEQANKAMADLRLAAVNDANNTAKLQMRVLGDSVSPVAKVLNETAGSQNTMVRNVEAMAAKLAKEAGRDIVTPEDRKKANDAVMAEIKRSQQGIDAQGQQVDQTSRALSELQARTQDVGNALNDQLVKPLQGEVRDAFTSFSNTVGAARAQVIGLSPNTQNLTAYQQTAKDIGTGKTTDKPQNIAQGAGKISQGVTDIAHWLVDKLPQSGRQSGSIGEAGKLIENFGAGTPIMLHGKETVLTEDQFKNIAKGMQVEGMRSQAEAHQQAASLNLDKMKKDIISFSTSSKKEVGTETGKEIDRKSLKFDQFGMPVTKDIKYKTSEIAEEIKKKEAAAAPTVEEMKKGIAAGKPAEVAEKKPEPAKQTPVTAGKDSSLSDVVTALNQVNSKLNQLIEVQRDIGQRQIKAVKANSKDVYNQ